MGWRRVVSHPVTLVVLLVVLSVASYVVGLQIKTLHVSYARVPPPQPARTGLPPPLAVPSGVWAGRREQEGVESLPASRPVRIDVPRLGIHAEVMATGLNEDGTVAVPSEADAARVAWYEGSAAPGQVGPAVLIGHVDSLALPQGRAVFYPLGAAQEGDVIHIAREDGTVAEFSVDSASVIAKDEFPTTAVYGPTDTPQLRLITCGGSYNHTDGYTSNIIIFAHYTGAKD